MSFARRTSTWGIARSSESDAALLAFTEHCHKRIGEAYFRTPRTTITAFVNLLAVLEQNPHAQWQALLGQVAIEKDSGAANDLAVESADEFARFKLQPTAPSRCAVRHPSQTRSGALDEYTLPIHTVYVRKRSIP